MQFQQLRLLRRIGNFQIDCETDLLALQELHEVAHVLAGQVVVGGNQQKCQPMPMLDRGRAGGLGCLMDPAHGTTLWDLGRMVIHGYDKRSVWFIPGRPEAGM
jgi:hypothetical protein